MKKSTVFLILCLSLLSVGVIAVYAIMPTGVPQKTITYQTNYWDFYSPFSDIYIKEMVPCEGGVTVIFYPGGETTFSFTTDGSTKKEIGDHYIKCTRSGNGKYVTITDTDIPFLPTINPFTWGTPVGNNSDFKTMREIFKTPREGDCSMQTDFIIGISREQGIITRRINLWQSPNNGILTTEGHTTMEVYDRETKQWIWMDPLYNIVEGKIGSKPITLREFQIAVNRGEDITLTTTDGETMQFNQWQYAKTWRNYLNPSQTVTYVIP